MRGRRRKRFRDKRRKSIYILPNLFTAASLFCGFYAIISSIGERYEAAAVAIFLSGLLDGLDGRVARLTRSTSQFGVEFDSLADLVAFGVAPALLAFQWALAPFGRLGWLAAFMYVVCGALRLARFNVQKSVEDVSYFKGLPIPAAACLIASLVLFVSSWEGALEARSYAILVMIYVLSFFMVSTIPYYSFKKLDVKHYKPFNVLVSIILVALVIAYKPMVMLFLIMLSYTLSGPTVTFYRLYRRSPFARRAPESSEGSETKRLSEKEGSEPTETH
jgi:CDP-diacylglycerol---serine O-phosphatidyltransferase